MADNLICIYQLICLNFRKNVGVKNWSKPTGDPSMFVSPFVHVKGAVRCMPVAKNDGCKWNKASSGLIQLSLPERPNPFGWGAS